jgi:hypothetical protein
MLEATNIPLSESLPTALGHTLGHIACLPFDETHLQLFSSKVRESIHDLRSLHLPVDWPYNPRLDFTLFAERHYQHISRLSEPDYPGPGDEDSIGIPRGLPPVKERRSDLPDQIFFEPPSDQFSSAQAEVKKLVQELGIEIVLIKDYLGNTPLHYLASARHVNDPLIAWFRDHTQGVHCWMETKNESGNTPRDLWVDNVTVIEPGYSSGPHGFDWTWHY